MSMLPATAAGVASVGAIRANFPALERRHAGHPVAYFDGPGGTQVPAVRRGRRGGLPAPPQREHALGLPDAARRPTRSCAGHARPSRRVPQRHPGRDRLRRQHDDAHLPPVARARTPVAGGGRGRRHRARSPRQRGPVEGDGARSRADGPHGPDGPRRPARRLGRPEGGHSARERGCSRSGLPPTPWERSPTSQPPRGSPTRWARWSSSTRCTTRRTCWWTWHALGLRLPGVLGLQVLRAARRHPVRARGADRSRSDVPKLEPAPESRAETPRDGHAEPRGHRGRRGSRRVPRVAGHRRGVAQAGTGRHLRGTARARRRPGGEAVVGARARARA